LSAIVASHGGRVVLCLPPAQRYRSSCYVPPAPPPDTRYVAPSINAHPLYPPPACPLPLQTHCPPPSASPRSRLTSPPSLHSRPPSAPTLLPPQNPSPPLPARHPFSPSLSPPQLPVVRLPPEPLPDPSPPISLRAAPRPASQTPTSRQPVTIVAIFAGPAWTVFPGRTKTPHPQSAPSARTPPHLFRLSPPTEASHERPRSLLLPPHPSHPPLWRVRAEWGSEHVPAHPPHTQPPRSPCRPRKNLSYETSTLPPPPLPPLQQAHRPALIPRLTPCQPTSLPTKPPDRYGSRQQLSSPLIEHLTPHHPSPPAQPTDRVSRSSTISLAFQDLQHQPRGCHEVVVFMVEPDDSPPTPPYTPLLPSPLPAPLHELRLMVAIHARFSRHQQPQQPPPPLWVNSPWGLADHRTIDPLFPTERHQGQQNNRCLVNLVLWRVSILCVLGLLRLGSGELVSSSTEGDSPWAGGKTAHSPPPPNTSSSSNTTTTEVGQPQTSHRI